jgi:hypothetical protein
VPNALGPILEWTPEQVIERAHHAAIAVGQVFMWRELYRQEAGAKGHP